jgi:pimeloyl-ACP methyl ester carboxylesterase
MATTTNGEAAIEQGEPLVIFSHGQESGPWGSKIQHLSAVAARCGYDVRSIDYRGLDDPEERIALLLEQTDHARSVVLVGSSMGAYVSARASSALSVTGLFLLAPAFGLERYGLVSEPQWQARHTTIVHGWNDDVVPPEPVMALARKRRARLHMLDDGHRLADSLPELAWLFEHFLRQCRCS